MTATVGEELDLAWEADNLAGNEVVAERAIRFARERVMEAKQNMSSLHRRWRLTYYMLSGNTIDQAGPMEVHVPELYKIVETMAPRIEEAILERDPWFRVRPRRFEDEDKANTIAAFIEWELAQSGFRRRVQESIRDLLVTQVCAFKILWSNESRMVKTKVREIDPDTGKMTVRFKRQKKTTYNGPRIHLIDPFDFLIDPRASDPNDAEWVGDITYYTIDELRRFEQEGFLMNVEKLVENKKVDDGAQGANSASFGWDMWEHKKWRSPTETGTVFGNSTNRTGLPRKVEVTTMCATHDLRGDGIYEECILVIGDGRVCLQAIPNFYDQQMRPYATARAARNGHNFFGVGILDNAVRLNQHLDRLHAITLRTAEGVACPVVFVEEGSDVPDSLYHTRPFKVVPVAGGKVTIQSIPGEALNALPGIMSMLSRDIEETVGTFKIQMGQEITESTATQATLALQEGSRRMRGIIRNYADMLGQLLSVIHKMNCQFVTDEIAFRVLGKRAKDLADTYLVAGPDTFIDDVDFEFVGLESLHTYGLKATGWQTIMSTMAPIMVQNPARIDAVGIMHDITSVLVGPDEADRYIKPAEPRDDRMAQGEENYFLRKGIKVAVSQNDPHRKHIQEMAADLIRLKQDRSADPDEVAAFMEHALSHQAFMDKQADDDAVRQQEMARNQPMQPPEAGGTPADVGEGSSPMAGGMAANPMPQGQTPGPPRGQSMGKAGRQGGAIPQTNNQPGGA